MACRYCKPDELGCCVPMRDDARSQIFLNPTGTRWAIQATFYDDDGTVGRCSSTRIRFCPMCGGRL